MKLKTKYLGWSCFSSKIIKLFLVKTVVGWFFLLNGQINISLFGCRYNNDSRWSQLFGGISRS
jgi:uncharacterized membrane protein HdeD (DUF308 family)